MNENISRLAEEATYNMEFVDDSVLQTSLNDIEYKIPAEFIEKFAELIVRECIQTLRDSTPVIDEHDSVEDWDRGYIRAIVDCEHHIQEHFGVEE